LFWGVVQTMKGFIWWLVQFGAYETFRFWLQNTWGGGGNVKLDTANI